MNHKINNKILIFDMDGVLFDTAAASSQATIDLYPGMTPEIQKEILTGNFHEELAKYKYLKKQETEEEKSARQKQYSEFKSQMPLFSGVKELLERLHGLSYIIVLNTSARERNCLPLLEKSKIIHLIDFAATADVLQSKTEKFHLIEEKYNVGKEDVLFVTDTLGDIKEAKQANVPTIAVTWGAHDKSFFTREPHSNLIKIVDTVTELENFIEQYWK